MKHQQSLNWLKNQETGRFEKCEFVPDCGGNLYIEHEEYGETLVKCLLCSRYREASPEEIQQLEKGKIK